MQIPLISLPFCLFRGRVIQHPCIGYIVSPRQRFCILGLERREMVTCHFFDRTVEGTSGRTFKGQYSKDCHLEQFV